MQGAEVAELAASLLRSSDGVLGGTGEPGRTYLHAGHVHGVESFSTKPHWYQDDHGLPFSRGVWPGHQACHIRLVYCKDRAAGHVLTRLSSLIV